MITEFHNQTAEKTILMFLKASSGWFYTAGVNALTSLDGNDKNGIQPVKILQPFASKHLASGTSRRKN